MKFASDDTHEWQDIGSDRPRICPCNKLDHRAILRYDDKRYARTNYQCISCKQKFSHYYHAHSPEEDMQAQDITKICGQENT